MDGFLWFLAGVAQVLIIGFAWTKGYNSGVDDILKKLIPVKKETK